MIGKTGLHRGLTYGRAALASPSTGVKFYALSGLHVGKQVNDQLMARRRDGRDENGHQKRRARIRKEPRLVVFFTGFAYDVSISSFVIVRNTPSARSRLPAFAGAWAEVLLFFSTSDCVSPLASYLSRLPLYLRTGTGACPYDCDCFFPLPSPVSPFLIDDALARQAVQDFQATRSPVVLGSQIAQIRFPFTISFETL